METTTILIIFIIIIIYFIISHISIYNYYDDYEEYIVKHVELGLSHPPNGRGEGLSENMSILETLVCINSSAPCPVLSVGH